MYGRAGRIIADNGGFRPGQNCGRPQLEKITGEALDQMCRVRGQSRHGNKENLNESLLKFKRLIQVRPGRVCHYVLVFI